MKAHKHAEVIKAWADGAIVDCFSTICNEWHTTNKPAFSEGVKYRINPYCEYAIEQVRKLGGDGLVEWYRYWLDGGKFEFHIGGNKWSDSDALNKIVDDPLSKFMAVMSVEDMKYRKKKRTVKQVLWVCASKLSNDEELATSWFDEEFNPNEHDSLCWHKVPTCVREFEK